MAGESDIGAPLDPIDAPRGEAGLLRALNLAREELGAAREALKLEREERARETREHALAHAEDAARTDELRKAVWERRAAAGAAEQARERLTAPGAWRMAARRRAIGTHGGRRRARPLTPRNRPRR